MRDPDSISVVLSLVERTDHLLLYLSGRAAETGARMSQCVCVCVVIVRYAVLVDYNI